MGEEGGPGAEQGGGQGAGRQGQGVQKQQETGAEGRKSGGVGNERKKRVGEGFVFCRWWWWWCWCWTLFDFVQSKLQTLNTSHIHHKTEEQ